MEVFFHEVRAIEYVAVAGVDEAVAVLAEHGEEAKVLAGGQSLLPLMALRLARPGLLVDVSRVPELRDISADGRSLGAAVTQRRLERSAAVTAGCPLLARALPLVAHPQIRNRGTLGGSLAHADPAAELPAVALATGAELVARSRRGERIIAAERFFLSYFSTALAADELLIEIRFPAPAPGRGCGFGELTRRHGDFALVACAAVLEVDDGVIADARLVFAGVADTPRRVTAAEDALRGRRLDEKAWAEAAASASADLDPPSDLHATASYRRHTAGVLARRCLAAAAADAVAGTGARVPGTPGTARS